MSRDAWLYFRTDDFPMEAWESLLARFEIKIVDRPLGEFEHRRSIVREWSFDAVDGSVFVTLRQIVEDRHLAPPGSCWSVSLNWHSHPGLQWWFVYAIPLMALAEFEGVIYCDYDEFVTCSPGDLIGRMEERLSKECDSSQLIARGLTTDEHPLLPRFVDVDELASRPAGDDECLEAAEFFTAQVVQPKAPYVLSTLQAGQFSFCVVALVLALLPAWTDGILPDGVLPDYLRASPARNGFIGFYLLRLPVAAALAALITILAHATASVLGRRVEGRSQEIFGLIVAAMSVVWALVVYG